MMMNLPCLWGSCPNFLRHIYHTLSVSQAPKQGHAPRKKPMPATALVFMFDCYWPAFTYRGTDLLSGRCATTVSCWSFADAIPFRLRHLRISVPEPCPVSDTFHQPLDRVLDCVLLVCFCFLCCHRSLCFCRALDTFQQFLRIISRPCLQDSVNHSQYLAGYHNQWLHLFQWILESRCIILMRCLNSSACDTADFAAWNSH